MREEKGTRAKNSSRSEQGVCTRKRKSLVNKEKGRKNKSRKSLSYYSKTRHKKNSQKEKGSRQEIAHLNNGCMPAPNIKYPHTPILGCHAQEKTVRTEDA